MSKRIYVAALVTIILVLGIGGWYVAGNQEGSNTESSQSTAATITATPTVLAAESSSPSVSYPGAEGKTALEILQETHPNTMVVGTGVNAYVTSIDGYAADDAKQEYWAFYVNGQLADVGAGSYATKDSDTIEWRIATY